MKVSYSTRVGEIAQKCAGVLLCGEPAQTVRTITTDSRDLGEECFFIPLRGNRYDGHDFIPALAQNKQIVGFITERNDMVHYAQVNNIAAIFCENALFAYGQLARDHRLSMPTKLIGITGTNGKTTTKELLWAILSTTYKCHKNEKNFNNEIGVPHALLQLTSNDEFSVIEMGMNHRGEIERLSKIACPTMAIITNIGEGHIEFLGSVENVAKAKAEIVFGMKPNSTLYVNADSPYIEIVTEIAQKQGVLIKTFGLKSPADIIPEKVSITQKEIEIVYGGESYCVSLYGIHNAYNLLIALAVGLQCGVSPERIKSALLQFSAVKGRSEIIEQNFIIINDTYNSNPLSAESALVSAQLVFPHARKIAVLSDMKELGELASYYHRAVGKKVHECGFDVLLTWGEFSGDIADGAVEAGMAARSVQRFQKKEELIKALRQIAKEGDVILIKGSRAMKMEEVAEKLLR